jgi:diguanylate cyclase (GGDEF)-like protein
VDTRKVEALIAASGRAAFLNDPRTTLVSLDDALSQVRDPGQVGRLLLARSLAQQGMTDIGPAALDAQASVHHLLEAGDTSAAAFATACAAGMVQRDGDAAAAIDLAVDALVLLPNGALDDENLVRAANAMAMVFSQLSAFELALASSRRAFEAALGQPSHHTRSITAYTLGYCATAAARSSGFGNDRRAELLTDLDHSLTWLRSDEAGPMEHAVLGSGMLAERVLLEISDDTRDSVRTTVATERDELEAVQILVEQGATAYPNTAPRLAAWHRLVRASVLRQLGHATEAERLLDQAIPELVGAGDEHRAVRAYNERSAARAGSMNLLGALDDARSVARLARQWQQHHVGRLASQIAQRADLEQARAQLRRRADDLAKQASEDPVTGLATRRWLEMRLGELSRLPGQGSVVVLDLDSFKLVNDTFGHQVGDVVLGRVGAALRAAVREENPVARFGGEEFVVLLPGTDQAAAAALAERVRAALHAIDWNDVAPGLQVTISAGVSFGPLAGVRELLRVADAALFEAKRSGRDCVVCS